MGRRIREASQSGREIGRIPRPKNPKRRARCSRDFRAFTAYFPETFYLPLSDDHLAIIRRIESVVLDGGLFALACPRGFGKTSMCEIASLWALLYAHHNYVAIIGPDEPHALDRVKNIKTELESNDRLLADFPEVCYPIRCLEGINQRRLLHGGRPVHIEFTARRIVLPDIPKSIAAGAIVATAGITGQIRGLNLKRRDGRPLRPSLVLIDDPQTDESAKSPSQCDQREQTINGAILNLAPPGKSLAALMPCTVVRADDLADRILDPEKNPQWQSERIQMVKCWPVNEKLWAEYGLRYHDDLRRGDSKLKGATKFYKANRKAMDEGAVVAWPEKWDPHEISAIQNVWNLRLKVKDPAFFAEFQQAPIPEDAGDDSQLTADQIVKKLSGFKRGCIPLGCTRLTAFVDIQQRCLFYLVLAVEEDFTGYIIDYGAEPDQGADYFALANVQKTLARAAPGTGLEGAIFAGLTRLTDALFAREWKRDDGTVMAIDRCAIDANWGKSTRVVFQWCRQSARGGVILPAHGRFVGASSVPMDQYPRRAGERYGLNWLIPLPKKREVRHFAYDVNFWKSFVQARFNVAMGDGGCLSLWGNKPERHRMIAEHCTAEYSVPVTGRGRTVDEWKQRPDRPDNHLWDCLVGAMALASMEGAALPEMESPRRAAAGRTRRERKIWRAARTG